MSAFSVGLCHSQPFYCALASSARPKSKTRRATRILPTLLVLGEDPAAHNNDDNDDDDHDIDDNDNDKDNNNDNDSENDPDVFDLTLDDVDNDNDNDCEVFDMTLDDDFDNNDNEDDDNNNDDVDDEFEVSGIITQVPSDVTQYVEKQILTQSAVVQEETIEEPHLEVLEIVKQVPATKNQYVDQQVPKPTFESVEKIVKVPELHVKNIQHVDKQVPKSSFESVENIVEAPQVVYEEIVVVEPQVDATVKQVPVTETQYVEEILEAPHLEIHETVKQDPVTKIQYVDQQVSKPIFESVEKFIEVPELQVTDIQHVDKQVPKPIFESLRFGSPSFPGPTIADFSKNTQIFEPHLEVHEIVKHDPVTEIQNVNQQVDVLTPFYEFEGLMTLIFEKVATHGIYLHDVDVWYLGCLIEQTLRSHPNLTPCITDWIISVILEESLFQHIRHRLN